MSARRKNSPRSAELSELIRAACQARQQKPGWEHCLEMRRLLQVA
jgi:hypothetical protein